MLPAIIQPMTSSLIIHTVTNNKNPESREQSFMKNLLGRENVIHIGLGINTL